MNNITGLTLLIMNNMNRINQNRINHMNRNLLKSEEDSNDSLFYCITPDRVVLSASSISYETETENVIVETIDGALIWFCMPREEYDIPGYVGQKRVQVETYIYGDYYSYGQCEINIGQ